MDEIKLVTGRAIFEDLSSLQINKLIYEKCDFGFERFNPNYFPLVLTSLTFNECKMNGVITLDLPFLHTLVITNNFIDSLFVNSCISLVTLDASVNKLKYVKLPDNIVNVDLSNNDLEIFNNEGTVFLGLKSLNLEQNAFDSETIGFSNFTTCINLETLNLSGNSLKKSPALPHTIKKISIKNDKLMYIPNLPNCETMKLNNCDIKSLPTCMKEFVFLTELNLNNNKIIYIMDMPPNLKILKVGSNDIKFVWGLPQTLEILNISNNKQLVSLPDLPKGLIKLDISYTGVKIIDVNKIPQTLQKLSINGTKIQNDNIEQLIEKYPHLTINKDEFTDNNNTNNDTDDDFSKLYSLNSSDDNNEQPDVFSKHHYNSPNIVSYEGNRFITHNNDADMLFPATKHDATKHNRTIDHPLLSHSSTYRFRRQIREHERKRTIKITPEWKRKVYTNPYYLCNTYDV